MYCNFLLVSKLGQILGMRNLLTKFACDIYRYGNKKLFLISEHYETLPMDYFIDFPTSNRMSADSHLALPIVINLSESELPHVYTKPSFFLYLHFCFPFYLTTNSSPFV